jgi:hypothetical protein
MKLLPGPILACPAACGSNPGVAPIGPDMFMVSRQAATGVLGLGSLKTDALREAERYCADRKRVIQMVNETESKPPYIFGNFRGLRLNSNVCRQVQVTPQQTPVGNG